MIVIGIDPHKSSLTAVAVDDTGHELAARRFVVNAGTFTQLTSWAQRWPQHRFAVEGAKGLGRGIAQQLAAGGADVVDVPATLAARARLLTTGGGRKTDATDAASVARVALHHHRLNPVQPEDQSTILRLLTEHRDDLTHERTRILNRLHGLLRELVPGGAPTGLSADKAATALRGVRPATATDACRRDIARHLLATLRRIDAQLKTNETQLSQAVTAAGSSLTELPGVGVIMAAKILGHVGNVARFPNADHFASYTGAAPIDASSGPRKRHRLNTGGNRQLNSALHIIAVVQAHHSDLGRAYYQRKLDEGKTPAEARRALKRRLANIIYRQILKDQKQALPAPAIRSRTPSR
ncbi:IS110 family transposase [Micromonospora sp. AKA38]|nr:IS110 family transposase [Micromonospora sp. AKA38]